MVDEFDDDLEDEDGDDIFAEFHGEYGEFEKVENKLSTRPDLHAFLLLDSLFPGKHDMVCAAEHDEIYLEVEPEYLRKVATKKQLLDLHRCGVICDDGDLCMFV